MIPKNIGEADAQWLSTVLGFEITQTHPEQIGQGVGIMGDIFRVRLESPVPSSERLPIDSVVVKFPSSFEENRAQGVALGMFEAEVRFYAELASELTVGAPQIYHTDIEPGTADFVIVMQDLSHLHMVAQADGMNLDQALAAVSVLARIHATWWDNIQQPKHEWIPAMNGPRIEFVDQLLPQVFSNFADGFAQYLPAGGLEIYEKFTGNYLKVNTVLTDRSPWTLNHQDYRVENLLFGPANSGEVVVLDWQGIGRGPGAYDLAYLLGGSMQEAVRREHEQTIVSRYHQQLEIAGVDGFSFEQTWEDYCLAHLMGGLATAILLGGAMDMSNERGVALFATMATRYANAALDHDGLAKLNEII